MYRKDRRRTSSVDAKAAMSSTAGSASSTLSHFAPALPVAPPDQASSPRTDVPDAVVGHASASTYRHPSPSRAKLFPTPRTSSLNVMGLAQSRAQSPPLPRPPTVTEPVTTPSVALSAPASSGSKLKLAWPGRRKKPEDLIKVPPIPTPAQPKTARGSSSTDFPRHDSLASQSDHGSPLSSSPSSSSQSHEGELGRTHTRQSSAKQLSQFASSTLHMLKGKLNASVVSLQAPPSPTPASPPPPPLPPKPASKPSSESGHASVEAPKVSIASATLQSDGSESQRRSMSSAPDHQGPSEGIVSVRTSREGDTPLSSDVRGPRRRERHSGEDQATKDAKAEDWRKSDSTLRTVRLVGSRTPRPLSLAESTNSGHTVGPAMAGAGSPTANKRLSVMLTDADFAMPEAEVESEDESVYIPEPDYVSQEESDHEKLDNSSGGVHPYGSPARHHSPTSSSGRSGSQSRSQSRASMRIDSNRFATKGWSDRDLERDQDQDQSSENAHFSGGSDSEAMSFASTPDSAMLTASSSLTSVSASSHPGEHGKAQIGVGHGAPLINANTTSFDLADSYESASGSSDPPWVASRKDVPSPTSSVSLSTSSSSQNGKDLPSMRAPPSDETAPRATPRPRIASLQSRALRQTAVSLTSGIGSGAGLAKGLGRRAVDRLGRALGGSVTNLSNLSSGPDYTASSPTVSKTEAPPTSFFSSHMKMGRSTSGQQSDSGSDSQKTRREHRQSSALRRVRPNASGSGAAPSISSLSDSDSQSHTSSTNPGPNLGKRIRGPQRANGGLVFKRDLVACVRDTAVETGRFECEEGKGKGPEGGDERSDSTFIVDREVVGVKALEKRKLPALVVRCAQHLVKWGVLEEGLFRVSGRSTHVNRIRQEFDSGADYDMSECGPGEIDPHAVASVFKAYLRELPEPLLTRPLIPYFEAALSAESDLINSAPSAVNSERRRGPGLPTSPTSGLTLRKPPSLSTFTVPTLTSRPPSDQLQNAFAALIARLPQENRDLLRTVTELIKITAERRKETKMPLSNLQLIFCPSLMMSPPLLRMLCEGEGIWDGPHMDMPDPLVLGIDTEKQDIVDLRTPSPDASEVDLYVGRRSEDSSVYSEGEQQGQDASGAAVPRARRTARRGQVATLYVSEDKTADTEEEVATPPTDNASLPTDTVRTSSDGVAFIGDVVSKTTSSPRSSPLDLYSPPALTSSSESLSTPASSIASRQASAPATRASSLEPYQRVSMRAQSDLPSRLTVGTRKSTVINPLPFPMSGSAPATPSEFHPELRMSTYSTSSPNLVRVGGSLASLRRRSRPSLQSLFPKRSLSSILLRASNTPDSPTSFITAPQGSRSASVCPVLDLSVEHSPIKFGAAFDGGDDGSGADVCVNDFSDEARHRADDATPTVANAMDIVETPRPSDIDAGFSRVSSSNSSTSTPSLFYTPSSGHPSLPPVTSLRSTSSYSLLDFGFEKREPEQVDDWASSVLLAAGGASTPHAS